MPFVASCWTLLLILFVKRYLFRHSTQNTFTSPPVPWGSFMSAYLQAFTSCEVALFTICTCFRYFSSANRPSTTHHFQKEDILFASSSSCTEGKWYFRAFLLSWFTECYNLGEVFMQRKPILKTPVIISLYYKQALCKHSMLLCQHISDLAWKTLLCPLYGFFLVRTTYLLYQIIYQFHKTSILQSQWNCNGCYATGKLRALTALRLEHSCKIQIKAPATRGRFAL